ncbi:MAG: prepilin-type N-terminal cleavage/methylation domain-containing protein [Candidatus Aminicenantes bacterium]|nr:prepilin-type N-terminal cleavage/methylation domain-containing protein [Candidatus Aminicenantes bacterium]
MDFSFSFMRKKNQPGFTLVEILVGGTIMTIVVIATLTLYMRSNKMAVDQQQFAEVQQDVRASMFFLSRDARSAGVGLTPDIAGYFLEGKDSFGPAPEYSDSLRVLGNFDNPLELIIEKYQGGSSGGAATAFLYQWSLENSPYQCPEFFENRVVLVISTRCPGCFTYRYIPNNSVFGCGTGEEHVNFQPGQSELNPPGGLVDTGCAADCWDDAIITLGQIRHFWVDTTGNPGDYPEFTAYLTPDRGYVVDENGNGVPNVLYMTTIDEETQAGRMIHLPLAQNIENLQIEYNGDYLNDDNMLDGFIEWQPNWTGDLAVIPKITQIRVWILGKTARPYVSFSGTPPANIHLYRRPTISNSLGETNDDMHRRFLLESTVTVRNMALNIYNTGAR